MKRLPVCQLICLLLLEVAVSTPLNETVDFNPGIQTFERYAKFKRQHVDKKMTERKCTKEMKVKNIYSNDNSCKETNTFILDDARQVKSICKGQGDYLPKSHLTKSKKSFSVIVCTLTKKGRKPRCEYDGKLHRGRFVVVQCAGVPVQLAENMLDFEEDLL